MEANGHTKPLVAGAPMTPAEAGRLGGLTTAARHGRQHMAETGAKGFAAYAEKYAKGNRAAARRMLGLDGHRRDYWPDPPEWAAWREAGHR